MRWPTFVEHRASLCESQNLASTPLPPLEYVLQNTDMHSAECCSTMQVETIAYACQSLLSPERCFLLGDSTGIGKSRIVSGVIRELMSASPSIRVLWVSVNMRLRVEANRELGVVGVEQEFVEACKVLSLSHSAGPQLAFTSYSALLNETTFSSVVRWLKRTSGKSLIVLDEAHCCRNDSATFRTISQLLRVPESMVLYSTATVASSLRHLRYLERMHIWGEGTGFADHTEFVERMRSNGTSVMELLSMQLKLQGKFMSRQMSFEKVDVRFEKVVLDACQRRLYDDCCAHFIEVPNAGGERQAFFQKLITRFKLARVIRLTHEALARGMSVVISVQTTGEAAMHRGEDSCGEIFTNLFGMSVEFPPEPIDAILDEFGADNVAELSGRQGRPCPTSGTVTKYVRDIDAERDAFQTGKKRVAIITRAGSTGISLHDESGHPRLHIIMELPWSSEDFCQQAGRSHRTNQLSEPSYIIVTTDVPSEARFLNCVAQRLNALGALTHGDRQTAISPLPSDTPNEWSVPARRLATIELWFRAKYDAGFRPRAATFTDKPIPGSQTKAEVYLLKLIDAKAPNYRGEVDERDDVSIPELMHMIQRVLPVAATWERNSWTRETHRLFHAETRERILAVTCCANRHECRHTLGAVPPPILDMILMKVADDPCGLGAGAAEFIETLAAANVLPSDMATLPCESVQNKMLSIPLAPQEVCIRTMISSAKERHSNDRGVRDLEDYIHKDGIRFTCVRFVSKSIKRPNDSVELFLKAEAIEEDFSDCGTFVALDRLSHKNALCTIVDEKFIRVTYATGDSLTFHRDQWDHLNETQRFVEGDRFQWDLECRRVTASRRAKATRCSRSYIIVVHNALQVWPESKKVVLRVREAFVNASGGTAFTGVLWK